MIPFAICFGVVIAKYSLNDDSYERRVLIDKFEPCVSLLS